MYSGKIIREKTLQENRNHMYETDVGKKLPCVHIKHEHQPMPASLSPVSAIFQSTDSLLGGKKQGTQKQNKYSQHTAREHFSC